MINQALKIQATNQEQWLIKVFSIITVISIIASILSYSILPGAIPLVLLGIYVAIVDLRLIYFALIALLAISTEVDLPGGVGTDLPAEPLMLFITGVYLLLIIQNPKKALIPLKNPISLLLLMHILWIAITAITSENQIVSVKFLLAKIWYVVPFYFAAFLFLDNKKSIQKMLTILVSMVLVAAIFVMTKHAALGFSFDTIEQSVQPIFRNHVNYACLLVITLPYLLFVTWYNRKKPIYIIVLAGINVFILAAIYFSFTRAAILSVGIGLGAFVVLKLKITRLAFIVSILAGIIAVGYMVKSNRYLDYAPNFERTISHSDFDNLLEATAKGEDISTMERVYRWIAGFRMIAERPIVGYGPNNFYPYYKNKTSSSFETYVSHNPEKSGIHCYYLMIPVEQGIPGFIIFILICFYILYEGEKAFHKSTEPYYRYLIAASYSSVIIILSILIVNDLLEADKVGPFFFLGAALIVLAKRAQKSQNEISIN